MSTTIAQHTARHHVSEELVEHMTRLDEPKRKSFGSRIHSQRVRLNRQQRLDRMDDAAFVRELTGSNSARRFASL